MSIFLTLFVFLILKQARRQKGVSKTRYIWEALVISQTFFVRMSSGVVDGRYILTTK
jgi:hypothetical protein